MPHKPELSIAALIQSQGGWLQYDATQCYAAKRMVAITTRSWHLPFMLSASICYLIKFLLGANGYTCGFSDASCRFLWIPSSSAPNSPRAAATAPGVSSDDSASTSNDTLTTRSDKFIHDPSQSPVTNREELSLSAGNAEEECCCVLNLNQCFPSSFLLLVASLLLVAMPGAPSSEHCYQ